MQKKIFISYERADAVTAKAVAGLLRDALADVDVFIDTKGVPHGADWWVRVHDHLASADAVVFVTDHRFRDHFFLPLECGFSLARQKSPHRFDDPHIFVVSGVEEPIPGPLSNINQTASHDAASLLKLLESVRQSLAVAFRDDDAYDRVERCQNAAKTIVEAPRASVPSVPPASPVHVPPRVSKSRPSTTLVLAIVLAIVLAVVLTAVAAGFRLDMTHGRQSEEPILLIGSGSVFGYLRDNAEKSVLASPSFGLNEHRDLLYVADCGSESGVQLMASMNFQRLRPPTIAMSAEACKPGNVAGDFIQLSVNPRDPITAYVSAETPERLRDVVKEIDVNGYPEGTKGIRISLLSEYASSTNTSIYVTGPGSSTRKALNAAGFDTDGCMLQEGNCKAWALDMNYIISLDKSSPKKTLIAIGSHPANEGKWKTSTRGKYVVVDENGNPIEQELNICFRAEEYKDTYCVNRRVAGYVVGLYGDLFESMIVNVGRDNVAFMPNDVVESIKMNAKVYINEFNRNEDLCVDKGKLSDAGKPVLVFKDVAGGSLGRSAVPARAERPAPADPVDSPIELTGTGTGAAGVGSLAGTQGFSCPSLPDAASVRVTSLRSFKRCMNACGAEISWALEDVQEWSRMARGKSSDCAGNGELRLALGVQSSLSIKAAYVTTSDTGDERFSATVDSEPHGGYVIAFCDRHSDIKQVKLHILLGGKSKDCEITFK